MKKSLFLVTIIAVLSTGLIQAQQFTEDDKKEGKMKLKSFSENETVFDAKSASDKWKSESAVILAQKFEYSFLQKYKNIQYEMTFRKRIKLQDKASVEEFSQFYWQAPYKQTGQVTLFGGDNSNKFYIEIKIIKPNGSVVDVSTKDAVEVKQAEWANVPRIFRGSGATGYKKLAIPNLEPGDIIDYFYFKRIFESDVFNVDFGTNTITLSEQYPVAIQKFALIAEKQFYISLNTYNGAPKFTSRADQLKYTGLKANDKVMIYTMEDKDRDKFADEPWSYELTSYPTMKFQVLYLKAVSKGRPLKGEKGVQKEKYTPEEIINSYQYDLKAKMGMAQPSAAIKYVKTKLGKETNVKKMADELYYAIRFYNVKDPGKTIYFDWGGMDYSSTSPTMLSYYENLPKNVDHLRAMNKKMAEAIEKKNFDIMDHGINFEFSRAAFCKALTKMKVPYRIALVPERQFGKIDDLLFDYEYEPVVVVDDGSNHYFYYGIGYDRTPEMTNYNVEGSEGIAYSPETWKKDGKVERIKIPVPSENFNRLNLKTQINFDPAEYESIKFKREITVTGDYKYDYAYLNWMNDSSDLEDMRTYLKDFSKKFKTQGVPKGKRDESQKLLAEHYPLRYKVARTFAEESLKDDYATDKIDTLFIVKNGRSDNKKDIVYKEEFKVKDLATKLGNNFSFNIGKIIGDQMTFEAKFQKDRKTNVDLVFPRTIEYEFTIEIPAGYKIEGMKDLNISVENDVAGFTSTATTMDNTILVKTRKVYKHNFEKKENWTKIVEATSAAYNFSQKKIILKKQ